MADDSLFFFFGRCRRDLHPLDTGHWAGLDSFHIPLSPLLSFFLLVYVSFIAFLLFTLMDDDMDNNTLCLATEDGNPALHTRLAGLTSDGAGV